MLNIFKKHMRTGLKSLNSICFATMLSFTAFSSVIAAGGDHQLQKAPDKSQDLTALQDGAKTFVNYCLNCHGASFVRYNQLEKIGLSDTQIKENLLFSAEKTGNLMTVNMNNKDAKNWFGAVPPDLSVIARARGTDWLYSYMRSFYVDDTRPTGWNNAVFKNVGMPHVLWELQGKYTLEHHEADKDAVKVHGKAVESLNQLKQVSTGTLTPIEYDQKIANLVAFLEWMGEPNQNNRKRTGVIVLLYLGIFTLLAWRLNANYWKDIK